MMVVENRKNLKVGDRVVVRPRDSVRVILKGSVVYVHDTNGWATVKLESSTIRKESDKPGVKFMEEEKKYMAPYNSSFRFEEIFHEGDSKAFDPNLNLRDMTTAEEEPEPELEVEPTAEELRESEMAFQATSSDIEEFRQSLERHYNSLSEAVARLKEKLTQPASKRSATYMCLG